MRNPLPLWALLLPACSDYNLNGDKKVPEDGEPEDTAEDTAQDTGEVTPGACDMSEFPAEDVGFNDNCVPPADGGFTPIVEWSAGSGKGCLSLPVVADLDGDGLPEVVVNFFAGLLMGPGTLTVLHGDGSGTVWEDTAANMAYGSPPAVADLDGDGFPEIVVVREYASALFADGDYTAALYDAEGNELWESEHFVGLDFDWATAPVISDMDHDGIAEIVVGRVILNADGTTRGVGAYGRGSYGIIEFGSFHISESSVPAVTDLDLDGVEEVLVGNAAYDADGNALRYDSSQDDAMIGVANLDDDPEGEMIGISYNTVRAMDTDGSVMWGPVTIPTANILAPPAIGDLDDDGWPEIVTAGGNNLWVLNHDGTVLWMATVHDESGATGASIFDFEGDGIPEVVYIDEIEMIAYDGPTGAVKFYSTEHASNTMFDYPVVADVDADDHAEILVCHNGFSGALSVYGDQDDSWRPVRKLWNQHAYTINNINDDLSVPVTATPNFVDHNTWHSAISTNGTGIVDDVESDVLEVCTDQCDDGVVLVTFRLRNVAEVDLDAGVNLTLYAETGGVRSVLTTVTTDALVVAGWTSDAWTLEVSADEVAGADALVLVADDDGTGTGAIEECSETNNSFTWDGPFCE